VAHLLDIGIFPDVEKGPVWPAVRALLQPAADQADGTICLDGRQVWTVSEGPRLIAAATTRTTLDGFAEVELVGGSEFRRWLKLLDDLIASWARDEGMYAVRAYGRRGWAKVLGWTVLGERNGFTGYERRL